MAFVSLSQAMAHCRAESEDSEMMSLYLSAAKQTAVDYMNRSVYDDQAAMEMAVTEGIAGENPMIVNDAINAAILLIVGHLYANREDVIVGVAAYQLPGGAKSILNPYRIIPGV